LTLARGKSTIAVLNTRTHKQDSLLIVYDADHIQHPGTHLFEPEHWKKLGAVSGQAKGRGRALLLDTEFAPAVLRQYLRGGWAARVSRNRYFFSGFERSRPVLEFNMLEKLSEAGLPVPEPLAAMCERNGAFYTGWLMMRRILNVTPLADVIESRRDDPELWRATGASIRHFHDFGLIHADLNARNILVGESDRIYLIDFDRARVRKSDSRAFSANLRRLHRSLKKLWPEPSRSYLEPCWTMLLEGYDKKRGAA
jgi:3-deoxy-D-manno-octulosonic acid kinase